MTATTGLRVGVADLLRRPGARRPVRLDAAVGGLTNGVARVDAPLYLDLLLERVPDGVVARGSVEGVLEASCSRCLRPVSRRLSVHLDELFEPEPLEGETYPITAQGIDLDQAVRDNLVLELPAAPLCHPGCRGLCPWCGSDRNERDCDCETEPPDSRWAALGSLDL